MASKRGKCAKSRGKCREPLAEVSQGGGLFQVECQIAHNAIAWAIFGVMHAIHDRNDRKIERGNAFNAGDINAKLLRVGAALVKGINPTDGAKIVSRCLGIKPVLGEFLLAPRHFEPG